MSSYVLDRELLLNSLSSARVTQTSTTNWLDANSNAALLGTTVYQRTTTDCELKKQMADVTSFYHIKNSHNYFSLFLLAPRPA